MASGERVPFYELLSWKALNLLPNMNWPKLPNAWVCNVAGLEKPGTTSTVLPCLCALSSSNHSLCRYTCGACGSVSIYTTDGAAGGGRVGGWLAGRMPEGTGNVECTQQCHPCHLLMFQDSVSPIYATT